MNIDKSMLTITENDLLSDLFSLRDKLDEMTLQQYKRINPLQENICDWRQRGKKYVSENSVVYDSATLIGDIKFGESLWIGPHCSIDGTGGLEIGSYCVFAAGVQIFTHDTAKWAISGGLAPYEYSPVSIGNCVFFGTQSIVTRGTTIGSHCLICANTTVTKDIPPYSIVAGSPGRVVGKVIVDGVDVQFCFDKTTS